MLFGLEGDPMFPYADGERPKGVIQNVTNTPQGRLVEVQTDTGDIKNISEYTIAPTDVWEFTEDSFARVMAREQQAYRAESAVVSENTPDESAALREEIASLRAEIAAEREVTKNFHNTYIASLNELASDVCRLDSSGTAASFCRQFTREFTEMQNRAEKGLYRGAENESDVDSLSDVEDLNRDPNRDPNMSDYF